MRQEIRFTGMSTRPSAHDAPGGELDYCAGLVNDGDGLVAGEVKGEVLTMEQWLYFKAIHEGRKIFVHRENPASPGGSVASTLKYYDSEGNSFETIYQLPNNVEVNQVSSLGKYLVVLTSAGVMYALWEGTSYAWLGVRPPMPSLKFGLQLVKKTYQGNSYKAHFLSNYESVNLSGEAGEYFDYAQPAAAADLWTFRSPDNATAKADWASMIQTAVVKLEADLLDKGLISGNIWIRYGYRMKTGETAFLSAPVLLCANTGQGPKMLVGLDKQGTARYVQARLNPLAFAYKIVYCVMSNQIDNSPWKNQISGVDIYITKPLIRYDYSNINPDVFYAADSDEQSDPNNIGKPRVALQKAAATFTEEYMFPQGSESVVSWQGVFGEAYIPRRIIDTQGVGLCRDMLGVFTLKDNPDWADDLRKQGPFYRLATINIADLPAASNTVHDLPYKAYNLKNITQMPVMTDTFRDLDTTMAEYILPYNARINLAGITYGLFAGHPVSEQIPMFTYQATEATVKAYVFIRENGEQHIVETSATAYVMVVSSDTYFLLYSFFYPNKNAYKAVLSLQSGGVTLPLEESPSLNGAYWLNTSFSKKSIATLTPPTATAAKSAYPNRVIQSNVASLSFPAKGVQDVGQNSVRALATTAKSVHEFQSGQDPLYVFTEDAVWSMSLNDDGTYLSVRPASYDPIRENTLPVQTDDSVAFISRDGVRVLSGGESVNISDILDSQATFRKAEVAKNATPASYVTGFEPVDISARFREFLTGAFLHFDYQNKRLYVFNSSDDSPYWYGYVFSKQSKTWAISNEDARPKYSVQSYPESYFVEGSKIKEFTPLSQDGITHNGLVFTRPMALADGALFNVAEVKAEGVFTHTAKPQLALYGTLDYKNWQLIATCQGPHMRGVHCPPFKAIRIGVNAPLTRRDSLTGVTIEFNPRFTARVR